MYGNSKWENDLSQNVKVSNLGLIVYDKDVTFKLKNKFLSIAEWMYKNIVFGLAVIIP